jgi:hypothetical protein
LVLQLLLLSCIDQILQQQPRLLLLLLLLWFLQVIGI